MKLVVSILLVIFNDYPDYVKIAIFCHIGTQAMIQ